MNTHLIKTAIKTITIALYFFFLTAEAENSREGIISPPKILISYSKAQSETSGWVVGAQWIWVPAYEYSLIATPLLRVTLKIPFLFEVLNFAPGVQLINEQIERGDHGIYKQVTLDVPFYYQKLNIRIKQNKGGEDGDLVLHMISPRSNVILVHYSCSRLGVSFKSLYINPNENISSLAITCAKEKQFLYVNVQHEMNWITALDKYQKRLKIGKFRGIITFNLEGKDYPPKGDLQSFFILDKDKKKVLEVGIKSDGRIFPNFFFNLGVAPTFIHYKESEPDVELESTLLKISGSLDYLFSASSYYLNASAEITPVLINSNEENLKNANFSSFDISLMKKIISKPELSWHAIGLGWLYWNMNTNNIGWGVDYMVGPEIIYVINFNKPFEKQQRFSLKVSPILNGSEIGFNNRFLDLQFSYELTKPGTLEPYFIFAQITNMSFTQDLNRKMSLWGGTLGIQKSF